MSLSGLRSLALSVAEQFISGLIDVVWFGIASDELLEGGRCAGATTASVLGLVLVQPPCLSFNPTLEDINDHPLNRATERH